MIRNITPAILIFSGLLILAAAIFYPAGNSRYAFSQASERLTYAKLDTRTGEAWLCGAELEACVPMTNKAAFLAYANRSDMVDLLRRAGFSDAEIKDWIDKQKRQP
jgi:hypothetical protein